MWIQWCDASCFDDIWCSRSWMNLCFPVIFTSLVVISQVEPGVASHLCATMSIDMTRINKHVTLSHYSDVILSTIASQITSFAIVYSTVFSDTDERKHQSSASLAFVRVIRRWSVNSTAQRDSNAGNVAIWWRHHAMTEMSNLTDIMLWVYSYHMETLNLCSSTCMIM